MKHRYDAPHACEAIVICLRLVRVGGEEQRQQRDEEHNASADSGNWRVGHDALVRGPLLNLHRRLDSLRGAEGGFN